MKWYDIDNDGNLLEDKTGIVAERSDVEKIIKQRDELLELLKKLSEYRRMKTQGLKNKLK